MLLNEFDFEVKPKELLSAQRQNKHFHVITFLPCVRGNLAQQIPALSHQDLAASLEAQS